MFMKELTIVALVLLLSAALAAATQPASPTTAPATAATPREVDPAVASFMKLVEPAAEDDTLRRKLIERHNTAVRLLELHIERYRNGVADSSAVFETAKDVAEAKMSLARTPAEREAAAGQVVEVTRSVESRLEKQFQSGLGLELNVMRARLARETAEVELLKLQQEQQRQQQRQQRSATTAATTTQLR
jgi:hypothetical protein